MLSFLYPTTDEESGEPDIQVFWLDLPQGELLSNLLHPTRSVRVFALLSVCERLPSLI